MYKPYELYFGGPDPPLSREIFTKIRNPERQGLFRHSTTEDDAWGEGMGENGLS